MPRLSQSATPETQLEFVAAVPLDLMNSMYFTYLAANLDGLEDTWPARVRLETDPKLLAELDFLYTFPKGEPGVMGELGDILFTHRETWKDVESLLQFVRNMPAGVGESEANPGVQGLALYLVCDRFGDAKEPPAGLTPRQELALQLEKAGVDVQVALALYDRPEELRERMARLIERFYDNHYRRDLPRRMHCIQRSAAAHRGEPLTDVIEMTRRLTNKPKACLENYCQGPYHRYVFSPSLDMGPYTSCAAVGSVHGLFYPCEPRFTGEAQEDAEETVRLARVYRALGDEQRLRILYLLREREMYAQEIVERTGLHQSVVSRHLAFMRAVGLLEARRQNNMKFFSINPAMREELGKTLELFVLNRTKDAASAH